MDTFKSLFQIDEALLLIDNQALIYLGLAIVMLWIGKKINDLCTPYKLDVQLTTKDNKAIAVSFSGYLFAIGIIVWSVLNQASVTEAEDPGYALLQDLGSSAIWILVGILLLQVARIVNDKLLLSKFQNIKELVEDQNIGTGAVQAGAFIGSAFMIQAAIYGEGQGNLLVDLLLALLYFAVAQAAFIIFAFIYQKTTSYDLHDEIEKDNAAAGVGFGLTLVAVGTLLSSYLIKNDSLIGLALWFLIGVFLLTVCRYVVDKLILPGHALDDEISKDKNWGAALIEGSAAIALALVLSSVF
jgi:uncharacterized membrane protein YjfL (UPF0719 family)